MTPNKIMFLDLETQNVPWFGAISSPRCPDNYVVMHGQAIDEQPYDGLITGERYSGRAKWLNIPDDVWLLVAHNAPFELDWALGDGENREELLKFLKRGGRVYCTAYGHYLLTRQVHTYPRLDEIAPLYGGTPKVDGIKVLWDQGVLTADIDPALLAEYLLGPEGDIANTRLTFWGQYQNLVERGMWQMALERMEGQLFDSFAMASGLYVDREFAEAETKRLTETLEGLQRVFAEYRSSFPKDCVFKESSDFHMSAWLYGGPLKYRARVPATDAEGKQKYVKAECYRFEDDDGKVTHVRVSDITTPEQFSGCVAQYGNPDRYKAGKNKGQPKIHKVDTQEPQMKWGELVYQAPGLLDLRAVLPGEMYSAFLETYTGKRKLSDDSPVISTSAEALQLLEKQENTPEQTKTVLRALLKYALVDKDLGTYFLREELDDDGNVVKQSGALQYMTPENIIHHTLNSTSTSTGRKSSARPNGQNFPRGDDNPYHVSQVKRLFTSRFGDDGAIIEADYTALEVVTLAALAQDRNLIEALVNNTDMHCLRLSKKLGEPYEDVLLKCKDQDHPEHAAYDAMRTAIKPPAFAYQYGATAMGIAFSTGMPVEEAERFIANEKALFPDTEAWYENVVFPEVERSLVNHSEQRDDGTWGVYGVGFWKSPAGTEYQFRQYPKTRFADGRRIETMEFKPTQMRNYPIQGESGFFVQGICGHVIRWLISRDFFGGLVHVINTVHDAIYLDCHKSVLAEVCATVKLIMENLPTYFSQTYGYTLNVPFPVGVEYGPSMQQKVKFKPEDFAQ